MTSEARTETLTQPTDTTEAPKQRRRGHVFARRAIAAGVAAGLAGGLAACAPEAPKPLEEEYSVGDIMLEADLAKTRHDVLEFCNTGAEDAEVVSQAWTDYGFEENTGMKWIDAFTYMADMKYDPNPEAIINDGSYTYPTIELLAENCADAAFLVSQNPHDIYYPETAKPLLEEFHTTYNSELVDPLKDIAMTI